MQARFGHRGKREYIQALRLLEDFPEAQVTAAVRDALRRRVIGFDAVKHGNNCFVLRPRAERARAPARAWERCQCREMRLRVDR